MISLKNNSSIEECGGIRRQMRLKKTRVKWFSDCLPTVYKVTEIKNFDLKSYKVTSNKLLKLQHAYYMLLKCMSTITVTKMGK